VVGTGDSTLTDATPTSKWRRPRTWAGLVAFLAAVIVVSITAPMLIGRAAEVKRLSREGAVVWGWVEQRDSGYRGAFDVRVSYDYGGRRYESWVSCNSTECKQADVLELRVDPRRPDRFVTEDRETNDDGGTVWLWLLMYGFIGLGSVGVFDFLRSVSADRVRQARRLPD